jgi:hypothetical protein
MPAQITEGKKLIEPTFFEADDNDKAFLANNEYSGILDDDVNAMLEFFPNLPEIPAPVHNSFSFPVYVNSSRMAKTFWFCMQNTQNSICISL